MENIVCAGFPAIVQCLLKLSLEELDRFLVGILRHESFPEIIHVLEARHFRQTGVHHHQKQCDEEVGVLAENQIRLNAQFAESSRQNPHMTVFIHSFVVKHHRRSAQVWRVSGPDLRGAQGARAPGLPPTEGLPPNSSYLISRLRDAYETTN